ncbi:serine O-acetyltransferase [Azospirillum sp. TSO35-2]|uniref:serine O-acetyltransferase n=1 Tax=Azospirillum sp. TSO35-2 TaxID=716796 RepID=UPI000D617DA1|nr:serine O-acetyltransferase [Azospirillum sp. TSO35-2]PWC33966.1 serine acetyltransferase [Azospirillum sp. TSO35-2]
MDRLDVAVRRPDPVEQPPWQPLWDRLRADAARVAAEEPALAPFLDEALLARDGFGVALAALLVRKLADRSMPEERLAAVVRNAMDADPGIVLSAAADLAAILARDPAADGCLTPFLYFKGFHALQWHRVAHWLWRQDRHDLAHFLQSRVSEAFAVDIHPAVPVGRGVFIDHGTGVVIGETAVIGNDVSILQNVTLGGTGKEHGDRHPKVRDGVLLSAGAKVLGNITIGAHAKVGAGSVVLKDVPGCATVAGVPARVVGWCRDEPAPALTMDQSLQQGDYSI